MIFHRQKIKVVFLSHSAHLVGSERSLLDLIIGMQEKNYLCHVLAPHEGMLTEELRKILVPYNIINLPWSANSTKFDKKIYKNEINKSVIEVTRKLEEIKPDVVYTNTSVIFQGAIAAKILGIKHIWHVREFGEIDHGMDYYFPIEERAKFIYKNSHKIIFVSNAVMNYYHRFIPKNKSEMIYNNVTLDTSQDEIVSDKKSAIELLIVGNVQEGKGQFDAVRAIKELKDRAYYNIRLIVIGDKSPSYFQEISNFVKDNHLDYQVTFHDFKKNIAAFYSHADVVLMCSRFEAFGRVTVESMLFGKPVIGTKSGGTPELIKDGMSGLFYDSGNINELVKQIIFFYYNPHKISDFGKYGKKICKKMFSKTKYVGSISNIIREQVNGCYELKCLFKNILKYIVSRQSTKDTFNNISLSPEQILQQCNFILNVGDKLIMTLLVRDEVDIIESNIKFHLAHGVDFIVATDNGSIDGTRNILEKYEKMGVLYLIDEKSHDYSQKDWVNRMGKLSFEQFNANFVFHCDADEFWYSKVGNLKDEIRNIHGDVIKIKVVNILMEDKGGIEKFPVNTIYAVVEPLISTNLEYDSVYNNLYLYRYPSKVILKKYYKVTQGNHDIMDVSQDSISQSDNIIIYHYPIRSKKHFFQKVINGGGSYFANKKLGSQIGWHWRRWYDSYINGSLERDYSMLLLNENEITKLENKHVIKKVTFEEINSHAI